MFGGFPAGRGQDGHGAGAAGSDHSWYASWAPSDHPQLVVVVMIEHGGFGADAAAPAAKEIYEAYFRPRLCFFFGGGGFFFFWPREK